MTTSLQVLHLLCTGVMTGIIWFVQIVQYPLFHLTDGGDSGKGHQHYTRRMGFVVMPVMLGELALQGWWIFTEASNRLAWTGTGLLGLIWLSTFLLQVPCHQTLCEGYDPKAHRRLVQTNWLRTIAWTARAGVIMLALIPKA